MVDDAIIIEANQAQEDKDKSMADESIRETDQALMSNFSTYEKQLRQEKYDNERYNSKSQNFNGRLLSAGANSIGNFASNNRLKFDSQGK